MGKKTARHNTRKKPPIMLMNQKDGDIQFGCPFCKEPHIIRPNVVTHCGARIEIMAVRTKLGTKGTKMSCMRCGESGGTLIKHNNGYVHDFDCNPNVTILENETTMELEYSQWAKFTFHTPKWLYNLICKYKKAQPFIIQDIDDKGNRTGAIRGYVWSK